MVWIFKRIFTISLEPSLSEIPAADQCRACGAAPYLVNPLFESRLPPLAGRSRFLSLPTKKTRMEASAFSVLANKGHLSYSINN